MEPKSNLTWITEHVTCYCSIVTIDCCLVGKAHKNGRCKETRSRSFCCDWRFQTNWTSMGRWVWPWIEFYHHVVCLYLSLFFWYENPSKYMSKRRKYKNSIGYLWKKNSRWFVSKQPLSHSCHFYYLFLFLFVFPLLRNPK